MPEVVVDEKHLARHRRQGKGPLLRPGALHEVAADGATIGGGEAIEMSRIDDFDAPRLGGGIVERGPDLELGVAVRPPEVAAVLVPGEGWCRRRVPGKEGGPVERDLRGR